MRWLAPLVALSLTAVGAAPPEIVRVPDTAPMRAGDIVEIHANGTDMTLIPIAKKLTAYRSFIKVFLDKDLKGLERFKGSGDTGYLQIGSRVRYVQTIDDKAAIGHDIVEAKIKDGETIFVAALFVAHMVNRHKADVEREKQEAEEAKRVKDEANYEREYRLDLNRLFDRMAENRTAAQKARAAALKKADQALKIAQALDKQKNSKAALLSYREANAALPGSKSSIAAGRRIAEIEPKGEPPVVQPLGPPSDPDRYGDMLNKVPAWQSLAMIDAGGFVPEDDDRSVDMKFLLERADLRFSEDAKDIEATVIHFLLLFQKSEREASSAELLRGSLTYTPSRIHHPRKCRFDYFCAMYSVSRIESKEPHNEAIKSLRAVTSALSLDSDEGPADEADPQQVAPTPPALPGGLPLKSHKNKARR